MLSLRWSITKEDQARDRYCLRRREPQKHGKAIEQDHDSRRAHVDTEACNSLRRQKLCWPTNVHWYGRLPDSRLKQTTYQGQAVWWQIWKVQLPWVNPATRSDHADRHVLHSIAIDLTCTLEAQRERDWVPNLGVDSSSRRSDPQAQATKEQWGLSNLALQWCNNLLCDLSAGMLWHMPA